MRLFVDLHIHSKYTRNSSRSTDFTQLGLWAKRKGIHVVGTGDCTHPEWLETIESALEPAEEGLFQLRAEQEQDVRSVCPPSLAEHPVRFMLTAEVATIYEKDEKSYKHHHILTFSSLDQLKRIRERMVEYGDIESDGRPTLHLSARQLLEWMVEEEDAYLIPAHIWNPSSSVLSTSSNLHTLEELFEDLTPHIFAVETGLSSSPQMCSRVSNLDAFRLVSFSDAHTPSQLGREATILNCELTYASIFEAIRDKRSHAFLGTLESCPTGGKFYLDGHSSCKIRYTSEQTHAAQQHCPVCLKPLTIGVLHRIEQLADRSVAEACLVSPPFQNQLSLTAILSELLEVGPRTQRVQKNYFALLQRLGPELHILWDAPIESIKRADIPLLSDAIQRLRQGDIEITPGYDGEPGTVRIFKEHESKATSWALFPSDDHEKPMDDNQLMLFRAPKKVPPTRIVYRAKTREQLALFASSSSDEHHPTPVSSRPLEALGAEISSEPAPQEQTSSSNQRSHKLPKLSAPTVENLRETPVPATSTTPKTRVSKRVPITSPNSLPKLTLRPPTQLNVLPKKLLFHLNTEQRMAVLHWGSPMLIAAGPGTGKTLSLLHRVAYIVASKRLSPSRMVVVAYNEYTAIHMRNQLQELLKGPRGIHIYTFSQLCERIEREWPSEELEIQPTEHSIRSTIQKLHAHPSFLRKAQALFQSYHVDEYQELSREQWELLRLLQTDATDFCAAGDSDQTVSEKAAWRTFEHFVEEFSMASKKAIRCALWRSYRSPENYLEAAHALISSVSNPKRIQLLAMAAPTHPIQRYNFVDEYEEASYITQHIQQQFERHAAGAPQHTAILYRDSKRRTMYQKACVERGLPLREEPPSIEEHTSCVYLLPAHIAKGTEFSTVYLTGCEQDIHSSSHDASVHPKSSALTAACRLFYVAMTRTNQTLILTQIESFIPATSHPTSFFIEAIQSFLAPLETPDCTDFTVDPDESINTKKEKTQTHTEEFAAEQHEVLPEKKDETQEEKQEETHKKERASAAQGKLF